MAVPGSKSGDSHICAHTFANVVVRSFFQAVGGQFVGMENFIQVFHSQAFRLAVKNTLHFGSGVQIPALNGLFTVDCPWCVAATAGASTRQHHAPNGHTGGLCCAAVELALSPGLLDQLAVWAGGGDRTRLNRKRLLYPGTDLYMENTGYDMMLWLAGLDGIPKSF